MVKRIFDLMAAASGLLVLSPVFLVIAGAIVLGDGGAVFYRQIRVGRRGSRFRIWKFRTMRRDADRMGPGITVAGDARVTRVGRLLRRYKLDELPQLINVVTGDMSLVGPRPEIPHYVALYTPAQRRVLEVRPGITDPASLRYRNEEQLLAQALDPERHYREYCLPTKLTLNLEYLRTAGLFSDLKVIFLTLRALLGFQPLTDDENSAR